jgi:hypothetical protein
MTGETKMKLHKMFPSATLIVLLCSAASAASTTYDLKADWSDSANPNGAWTYSEGFPLSSKITLPHNDVSVCCGGPSGGVTAAWAPSSHLGNILPLWAKATGDNSASGYLAGDIIVHSTDGANGNPSLGFANVSWTAPADGTVEITGAIWYAHFGLSRSNDFVLVLNDSNVLASGTVSATNGRDRGNPIVFARQLRVKAGDVILFYVVRSPGQVFGSFAGVNLTITEQTLPAE